MELEKKEITETISILSNLKPKKCVPSFNITIKIQIYYLYTQTIYLMHNPIQFFFTRAAQARLDTHN